MLGGIDRTAGYNLEAAIAGAFALWLVLTGGNSGRLEARERAIPEKRGTPAHDEKLRRLKQRYPERLWLGRLIGAALLAVCGVYFASSAIPASFWKTLPMGALHWPGPKTQYWMVLGGGGAAAAVLANQVFSSKRVKGAFRSLLRRDGAELLLTEEASRPPPPTLAGHQDDERAIKPFAVLSAGLLVAAGIWAWRDGLDHQFKVVLDIIALAVGGRALLQLWSKRRAIVGMAPLSEEERDKLNSETFHRVIEAGGALLWLLTSATRL